MEVLVRPIGPLATNVYILGDERSREAIAIDTATPCLGWLAGELRERGWRLRLIVSTHGHWDHIGDNAAVQAWSREQLAHLESHRPLGREASAGGADGSLPADQADTAAAEAAIAVHPLDRDRLVKPSSSFAPFEVVPSVPAVELAEGGRIRFGELELEVWHTPGHTEGSVCLLDSDEGLLFSGDTLFAAGWGRVDLAGGSAEQMVESLTRLSALEDRYRVLPGHGPATTLRRERPWLELVAAQRRLLA